MNPDTASIPARKDFPQSHPRERDPFDAMFKPNSVAVIGATERADSVGRAVVENLLQPAFRSEVYLVNPKHSQLLGHTTFPSIDKVPAPVDLAVIVTPAQTVPGIIHECVAAGVRSAVVISAGFRELGESGAKIEEKIKQELRGSRMRLVGPNCLGVMNPIVGLNATFAQGIARSGNVAFLSQSGALLTAILDWSFLAEVGFSAIVSTGSMLDVGWGDLIDYFGSDPHTQSILIYMESIGDARSFLSAAREVAIAKPIIVIKAGRTEAASKAASSHTGALTGSDEVLDAALRRCGVLRVQSISDIFYMADVLSKQPRPRGPRLMILTNAGGPAVLATDALIANGGELAPLSEESRRAFDQLLPPHWSRGNPVDILGDADPERYARALEIAIRDPNSDGLLAILAPQRMTDPARVAERVTPYAKGHGKPLLASWMGGKEVEKAHAILNEAGIPVFSYADTAARAFDYMWLYTYHLAGLYETPAIADDPEVANERRRKASELIDAVLTKGRTLLTEFEAKQLLALYDIPTVPTFVAQSAEEAASRAEQIGFPVVLKLHSEIITHKTDVGGVKLNLTTRDAVTEAYREIESSVKASSSLNAFQGVTVQPMIRREGYELILGSSIDPQFGPVLLFGLGGQLVEVFRDRALGLPPLNTTLAQRMMEQTKIYRALKGVRGRKPVDLQALESLLVRFSYVSIELPRIKEIDINPLLASPEGSLVLDARIVLHDTTIDDPALPKPGIRPYPVQYISRARIKDGREVLIRPIRPEDEPAVARFHETLSEESVYLRYFHMENLSARTAHQRLMRKCFIDYDREMALVVELEKQHGREVVAIGRLTRERDTRDAEIAIIVSDHMQQMGIGTILVERLIDVARKEKFQRLLAHVLVQNAGMLALAKRFHFSTDSASRSEEILATLTV